MNKRRAGTDKRFAGAVALAGAFFVLIPTANSDLSQLNLLERIAAAAAESTASSSVDPGPPATAAEFAAPTPRLAPEPPAEFAVAGNRAVEFVAAAPAGDLHLAVRPGASLSYAEDSHAAERRFRLEVAATTQPAGDRPRVWLVGGVDSETYAMAPGDGLRNLAAASRGELRDMELLPVGSVASVGDAHAGLALELGEGRWASLGYVREERRFELGTQNWEETDEFVGVTFHARW
ncbi:hypothetical protein [Marinicauda salina]|uniref:hypothetical protein n=1 Tax=Marinicauda salina TaxID=2135793 RepID=UPI001304FF4B|nr:hypothetical protein [Marinicauda salina]